MTGFYSSARAELKAMRQLVVRFGHAPSVKLTLEPRPAAQRPSGIRVLRLSSHAAAPGR